MYPTEPRAAVGETNERSDKSYLSTLEEMAQVLDHQVVRLGNMLSRYHGAGPQTDAKEVSEVPSGYAGQLRRIERGIDRLMHVVGDLEDIM